LPCRAGDRGAGGGATCARAGLPGAWVERPRKDRAAGPARTFRPVHTPHDLRHTWASWHYALHRDLLRLKQDGGWSSVVLVERYAHLVPEGHEDAIRRLWGDWHAVGTAPVVRALDRAEF
jgi:hypothetical protein